MSKNLEIAIKMAKAHYEETKRNTIIYFPKRLKTQVYGIFNKNRPLKGWWYVDDKFVKLRIAVAEISGQSGQHYETMYVINPQEIEDKVLDELKMVPCAKKGAEPMMVCINI